MTIIRARRLPNGTVVRVLPDGQTEPFVSAMDWAQFDAMTEEEVMARALADPDAQPWTDEQLARAKYVPRTKTMRRALGLTQEEFALRYHIPIGTLRDWEQGRSEPDQTAKAYLHVIAHDPEGVAGVFTEQPPRRATG